MTAPTSDAAAIKATEALLAYYNFQDEQKSREQLLDCWLRAYPLDWVRLALIEALYQGRYKSASVEYLLQLWQRRGQAVHHFSREFERLVSHNCPQTFLSLLRAPEQEPQRNLSTFIDELLAPSEQPVAKPLIDLPASKLSDEDEAPTELEAEHHPTVASAPSPDCLTLQGDDLEELESQLIPEESHAAIAAPSRVNSATPIHRFKPSSRPSELYTKLSAMANAQA